MIYLWVLLTFFLSPLTSEEYQYAFPTLSLSSSAKIKKAADEFTMNISVVTTSETAKTALADNNEKMEGIIGALLSVGLPESDYHTGRFTIRPTYTPYPKNPPPDWQATINGYEVTNSLSIQSKKLDLIGGLIDAAGRLGATNIDDVRFSLSDPDMHLPEAIEKATNKAMGHAQTMAKAAKVSLGKLVTISLDTPQPAAIYQPVNFAKGVEMGSLPPIEPGEVTLSATVHLVYEIAEQ